MKIDHHILVIISILSLFFVISIECTNNSPSSSKEKVDELKKSFGPKFGEAKDKFGPISSLDLDQLEEAKEAFGPIPSFDEAREALGPASSSILKKAKEALSPISPSTLDEAEEALGPISPSTIDEAKKALGPASSKAKEGLGPASSGFIDRAREKLDSLASWINQNKEETSSEAPDELEPSEEAEGGSTPNESESSNKGKEGPIFYNSSLDPYGVLKGAKRNFKSLLDSITEDKEQISPSVVEEAENESSPVSSNDTDEAENKMGPISTSDVDAPSPTSAPVSSERSELAKIIDEAKSLFNQNKEEISSGSPSISVKSSAEDESSMISVPALAPIVSSTFEDAKEAIGSYSSKAMDAAKEKFSSIQSYLSQNKVQISPESDIRLHSTSVYLDHDVALAIESMIKQAQSNAQLAMDEAKTLVSDPTIDPSSDTGKCVQKCMANYESCNQKLNKAMENLKARNVELLKDDITEVEGEIHACQKCFLANTQMQSVFKDLEEATIKAARECLNVLDHSG